MRIIHNLVFILLVASSAYALSSTDHYYGDSFTQGDTQNPNQWRIIGAQWIASHSQDIGNGTYDGVYDNQTIKTHGGSDTSNDPGGNNMEDNFADEIIGWGNGSTVFASALPRGDINLYNISAVCDAIDRIMYNISKSNNFSMMLAASPSELDEFNYDDWGYWSNWSQWHTCTYDFAILHSWKVMDFVWVLNNNWSLTAHADEDNTDHPGPLGGLMMGFEYNRSFWSRQFTNTDFDFRTFINVTRCLTNSAGYCVEVPQLEYHKNASYNWVSLLNVTVDALTVKPQLENITALTVKINTSDGIYEADKDYRIKDSSTVGVLDIYHRSNSDGSLDFVIDTTAQEEHQVDIDRARGVSFSGVTMS